MLCPVYKKLDAAEKYEWFSMFCNCFYDQNNYFRELNAFKRFRKKHAVYEAWK